MHTQIKTNYGLVKGTYEDGVRVWRGIPYAKLYTGRNRFHEAKPADSWEGILDATAFTPSQFQLPKKLGGVTEGTPMAEESLSINIWAPKKTKSLRPVMMWIYGGAFATGDGSMDMYDGRFLTLREDVVVVNFDYRINAFGFIDFSAYDKDCSVNCGLKDQVMALKWVYENIKNFGGDPNNITIFGQSAGGNSVVTLLSVPAARKYIAKGIAMSAYPGGYNTREQAKEIAGEFLKILDISPKDFEKLYTIDAMTLVNAAKELEYRISDRNINQFALVPVVDGTFLPMSPIAAAKAKLDDKVIPLIMGTVKNEASIYASAPIPLFTCTKERFAEFFKHYDGNNGDVVVAAYSDSKEFEKYMDMGGQALFSIPSLAFAETYSENNPVWFYRFEYYSLILKIKKFYTMHGTDIAFVFDNLGCSIGKTALMLTFLRGGVNKLARRFSHEMTNFAKTGKATWAPFTKETHAAKIWNIKDRECTGLLSKEMDAWRTSKYFQSL